MMDNKALQAKALAVRQDIIRELFESQSGHPGGSLSSADIMTVLFFDEMNVDPKNPKKKDRDRFVLSKGHAAPVLYAVLAERGYIDKKELMTLRKINTRLQGHPSRHSLDCIEISTGSLGQGISAACGMALAAKMDKSPARVYTVVGDGELQEGLVWEAAMFANHYKLSNLVCIVDHNGLQIDGRNDDVMKVMPIAEKFAAFGWNVIKCDGHNIADIKKALSAARKCKDKPSCIVAETHKGKGVSFMEDQAGWHGKAPNREQAEQAMKELGGEL
jgi:transketolase